MKTKIFLTLTVSLFSILLMSKQAAAQEEFYVDGREQIEGFYTLTGTIPTAFKTIEYIELRHGRDETPTFGSVKLKGKKGTNFNLNLPTLNDKNISLKTKAVKGISYEFTGAFTRLNLMDTSEPDSKEIVLKGKLKKISAGKVVAEMEAQFTYYWGT